MRARKLNSRALLATLHNLPMAAVNRTESALNKQLNEKL
jgi:hypothetical protein